MVEKKKIPWGIRFKYQTMLREFLPEPKKANIYQYL